VAGIAHHQCCCGACADCVGTADTATVTLDGVLLAATCQGPCPDGIEPVLGGTMYHWSRVDAGAVDGTYAPLNKTVSTAAECRWEGVFDGPTFVVVRDGGSPSFNPAVVDCDTLPGETDPDSDPGFAYNTFHRRSSTQIKITLSRFAAAGGSWRVKVESYGSTPTGIPYGPSFGTDPGPIAEGASYFDATTADDCDTPPAGSSNGNAAFDCFVPGKDGTATASFP